MFVFLPYRSDSPVRRAPLVNYALIALNVAIFGAIKLLPEPRGSALTGPYMIWPLEPAVYQFITYQFLHGDLMHLAGNMLFLWVFGNSVNSKMGNVGYGFFYLACGVLAGVGFLLTGAENPCLGASGAIAGVTTAYLALFPRSEITVFYWIWLYVGATGINSMWLIIGKMIVWDNFIAMQIPSAGVTNVAYSAHLVGYLAGFVLAMLLLALRALPRDHFDMLALWKRAYHRRAFATAMADPEARARAIYGRVARPVEPVAAAPAPRPSDPAARLREAIADALSINDYDAATARYEELIALDADQVLPRAHLITVANQLMVRQRYPLAAAAYEQYLRHYPATVDADQIKLLLGIIYARYLERYEQARRYLADCAEHLASSQQREQAAHWLREISAGPEPPPTPASPGA